VRFLTVIGGGPSLGGIFKRGGAFCGAGLPLADLPGVVDGLLVAISESNIKTYPQFT
jgi:hypothetical protein